MPGSSERTIIDEAEGRTISVLRKTRADLAERRERIAAAAAKTEEPVG